MRKIEKLNNKYWKRRSKQEKIISEEFKIFCSKIKELSNFKEKK